MIRTAGLALVWVILGVSVVGWVTKPKEKKPTPPPPWFKLIANPAMALSGNALCVRAIIPRHVDNRQLAVAIDCENFFRSWQEQLNGENAQPEWRWCFDSMPPGRCVVGATLYRVDPTQTFSVDQRTLIRQACFSGMEMPC